MSVLLNFSKLLQKAEPNLLIITPTGECNFEDHLKCDSISPYDFLNFSNNRTKLTRDSFFEKYKANIQQLLRIHKTVSYIEKNKPILFEWNVNGKNFKSTSLFFEYYMLNLMHACNNISAALTNQTENANDTLKEVKNTLLENLAIIPEWKTTQYILPSMPVVATEQFVKQLIYFTHATQAFFLAYKNDANPIALQTAIDFYDKVWYRAPIYGKIALNHLTLAKSLLLFEVAKKVNMDDEAEKKYSLLKEAKTLFNLVDIKQCFLDNNMKNININEDCENDMKTLEDVYYTQGDFDINDMQSQRTIPLKVCPQEKKFGCKCNA